MMFHVCVLLIASGFLNIIHATQNLDHESEYNCTMKTVDNGVREKIARLLEDGKKVIFLHLSFTNQIHPFSDSYRGDTYKPLDWVRIAGRHGRSLLFLRPEFEQLSLSTLSLETGYMDVALVQKPKSCLMHFNTTIAENKLRDLLLSDFESENNGGSLSEHEYICNMHIRNDNSKAQFFYHCCHKDPDGNIVCNHLIFDYWIYVVFICVIIINVVAIMFSPYLIPVSLYREIYGQSNYEHELLPSLQIKVKKVFSKKEIIDDQDKSKVVPLKNVKNMTSFYKTVKALNKEEEVFSLDKINITVPYRRLIPANYVPVGIFKTFYTMFVKCHIRKSSQFGRCCRASIFSELDIINTICNSKYAWFKCLKQFMQILVFIGISLPWIMRIIFFYCYEQPHTLQKIKAASERNMTLSFQWNLTNTLTPMHILFLLCYIITVIDALVFGIVSPRVKDKLQLLMRKCLRDMHSMSRSKAFEWSALVLVVPFEKFGILGFFLFGIYFVFISPVIALVLAFYCLPTINLVFRLLVHFFAYLMPYAKNSEKNKIENRRSEKEGEKLLTNPEPPNKESKSTTTNPKSKEWLRTCHELFHFNVLSNNESVESSQANSTKKRFLQLFVLIACLSTVLSFILLTMELVLFITEIFIYTIIGIIMNASAMLKYISLIFMLVLYARDCFNGISDKYLEFNKSINQLIVDEMRTKVFQIAKQSKTVQKNTAFQVHVDDTENIGVNAENDTPVAVPVRFGNDSENVKLLVKDGRPKWETRRLILFLDANDKPYLPEQFFKVVCYMDTAGVPGPLIYNIAQATFRFLCICVFLMFVVLIVLAFGDEYQISGTNQMLATLAGGFLPWVFRNILFKSKDSLALDTNNLSFKSNFQEEIRKFVQNWEIADIVVKKVATTQEINNSRSGEHSPVDLLIYDC